jgi:predicted DNA-binding WGR domain protein
VRLVGSTSSTDKPFSVTLTVLLDKLRPQIEKQITQSNVFYNYYLATKATAPWALEEPVKRRFEFVGGKSSKYWEIDSPHQTEEDYTSWLVHVHYGRIGTDGQHHTKVFGTEWQAEQYYKQIVAKKVDKGYEEKLFKFKPASKKPKAKKITKISGSKLKVPIAYDLVPGEPLAEHLDPCEHKVLTNLGKGRFKCFTCKHEIEMGKAVESLPEPEVQKKVKRFINLNWRKDE